MTRLRRLHVPSPGVLPPPYGYSRHTLLQGGSSGGLVGLVAGADQPQVNGILLRLQ